MNDLTIYQSGQLPDTKEDLAKFVIVGQEKLKAVKAAILAIEKVNLAEEVHQQKLAEAQELGEVVIDAEIRLGQLLREVPKSTPNNNPFHENVGALVFVKPKQEVYSDLGLSIRQAEVFQQMARAAESDKNIVEKAKQEAKEDGRVVTRSDVTKRIATPKHCKPSKQKEVRAARERTEDRKENQTGNIVSFSDKQKDMEDKKIIGRDFYDKLSKVADVVDMIVFTSKKDDVQNMIQSIKSEEVEILSRRISRTISTLSEVLHYMED